MTPTIYFIYQTRNYYGPKRVTAPLLDQLGEVDTFKTREAAQEWIDLMEAGEYHLGHNESSRPTYRIVELRSEK